MNMNNFLILPILIPLFTGIILIFLRHRLLWQRVLSLLSFLSMISVSIYIIIEVANHGIQTLNIGGWVPPFGIVLVADMFACLLVLTASVVALACVWFAFKTIGAGREKHFFYPILQFLLVGVCGSFLTGDIFN